MNHIVHLGNVFLIGKIGYHRNIVHELLTLEVLSTKPQSHKKVTVRMGFCQLLGLVEEVIFSPRKLSSTGYEDFFITCIGRQIERIILCSLNRRAKRPHPKVVLWKTTFQLQLFHPNSQDGIGRINGFLIFLIVELKIVTFQAFSQ